MTEVAALETRVTRMENQISAGFERIEGLLRNEIDDLKREQLSDLRDANRRLGDDQRRLWEGLRTLEARENQRFGGDKKLGAISHLFSIILGGLIATVASWFSGGGPHPPAHP